MIHSLCVNSLLLCNLFFMFILCFIMLFIFYVYFMFYYFIYFYVYSLLGYLFLCLFYVLLCNSFFMFILCFSSREFMSIFPLLQENMRSFQISNIYKFRYFLFDCYRTRERSFYNSRICIYVAYISI